MAEKIRLKDREDLQIKHIQLTTSSSDAAEEEQFFFTQADNEDMSEEQTLEQKDQCGQNAKQYVATEEPASLKTSLKEFTKIDGNTTS